MIVSASMVEYDIEGRPIEVVGQPIAGDSRASGGGVAELHPVVVQGQALPQNEAGTGGAAVVSGVIPDTIDNIGDEIDDVDPLASSVDLLGNSSKRPVRRISSGSAPALAPAASSGGSRCGSGGRKKRASGSALLDPNSKSTEERLVLMEDAMVVNNKMTKSVLELVATMQSKLDDLSNTIAGGGSSVKEAEARHRKASLKHIESLGLGETDMYEA